MLDLAINYEEELKIKFRSLWFSEKYKYYNYSNYYDECSISNSTWDTHQFVVINNNDIIGYIGYEINRSAENVSGLAIVNFTDNKLMFGVEIGRAIRDIFEKFKFNKISFSVVIGNPIENTYDRLIKRYNGRIVGIEKEETKLFDGNYYDVKRYEILKSEYLESRERK